ncbi:phosphatase PAP2 family protein [Tomitella fengzijianii]|uniref:phosphatase PAP2 family protein n=1 Tax=Tomitella fengzijianii TaxID=2597660 RepID=UPI001E6113DE|nr:phosphatase PAP2 family protein [Tomitella fengzijianii]
MTQLDPDVERAKTAGATTPVPAARGAVPDGTAPDDAGAAVARDPDAVAPDSERQRKLVRIRRSCYAAWAVVVVLWLTFFGFPFDRNRLLILICLGLLTVSIGRRPLLGVIRDWLPFALLLAAYDLSRYLAIIIGLPTHWHLAVDVDKWMFGGTVPTVWLQEQLKTADIPWWEIITSTVYMSFFLIPYVVAAFLWVRDRVSWRKYVIRFVAISFAALIGYIFVPAAPPWAAARCTAEQVVDGPSNPDCMFSDPADTPDGGLLGPMTTHQPGADPHVERISTRGWDATHLMAARKVVESGQKNSNMVAAIPSLHAGLTALIAMFMWPRVRKRWRLIWAAYALTMAFALVYTAEHYVFDILIGWALAVAVLRLCPPVDRWWDRTAPKVSARFSAWRTRRARAGAPVEGAGAVDAAAAGADAGGAGARDA